MKIGIFDSGLGGLVVGMSIMEALPLYDYIYLGDTKRVPYGNRDEETLFQFAREGVDFLFRNDCVLIILACNTASAEALRKIQQQYLPANYPDRRVLGVIIPAAEESARRATRIGVLATESTVRSNAFIRELQKVSPEVQVFQQPAPKLVPMIEGEQYDQIEPVLREYLEPLLAQDIQALNLGCTHYALLKDYVRKLAPHLDVFSQDEIIPEKVADYLRRHPEIESRIDRGARCRFFVTEINECYRETARRFANREITLEQVAL